jgi:hypothetical protein
VSAIPLAGKTVSLSRRRRNDRADDAKSYSSLVRVANQLRLAYARMLCAPLETAPSTN